MPRVAWWTWVWVLTVTCVAVLVSFALSPKRSIIEELTNPKRVVGRTFTGLVLEDGRRIELLGVRELRPEEETPFLNTACSQGIEIDRGPATGLMKIHHWCGNDSVRTHIARVDLADLVLYVGDGTGSANFLPERADRSLTKSGWNISNYVVFLNWRQHLKNARPLAS